MPIRLILSAFSGAEFRLQGKPFFFAGSNAYFLWYGNYECSHENPDPNGQCVTEFLDEVAAMGFSVVRTWAFSDGPEYWGSLQPSAGIYSEASFAKMDRLIYEAGQRNLKILFSLVNNWSDFGGMCQYVQWCGIVGSLSECSALASGDTAQAQAHDAFYTDDCTKNLYKNYVSYVLNRTNSITGIKYKNDPAIFGWELGNEPRAKSDGSGDTLYNWLTEMSAYLKTIDSNHMVATGEDGFYVNKDRPEYGHHGEDGGDFIRNSLIPTIDYASFHIYDWSGYANSLSWIQEHAEDARLIIGKPLVAGELGYNRNSADFVPYMQGWYDKLEETKVNGDLLWMLCPQGFVESGGRCVYYPADPLAAYIESHADYMNNLQGFDNNPPVLDPIANIEVDAGDIVAITASAADPDGDLVSYMIDSSWFEQNDNVFIWQTTPWSGGTYSFRVVAHDGDLGDSQVVQVTVRGEVYDCVFPVDGMVVNDDTIFCPGTYPIPSGISISRAGVTLECMETVLQGEHAGTGIDINSGEVTVKGCCLEDYDKGIWSEYHNDDVTLENNTIINTAAAIALIECQGNNVIGNTVVGGYIRGHNANYSHFERNNIVNPAGNGFSMHKINNNTFVNNVVNNCSSGFYLYDSALRYNEFRNNTVENCIYGFQFRHGVTDNLFIYNKLINNTAGVYHGQWAGTGSNNTFSFNLFKNNQYGIDFYLDNNAIITDNLFLGNNQGIYLRDCTANSIYRNLFVDSTVRQAYDWTGSNFWDLNGQGNYWSDYDQEDEGCLDVDADNVCDEPFSISNGSADNAPIAIRNYCPPMPEIEGIKQITWCCQLQDVSNDTSADYALTGDVDCSASPNFDEGLGFKPIWGEPGPFTGSFDGGGAAVIGLNINRPEARVAGLFGMVGSEGSVSNVNLLDCTVVGDDKTGCLVGYNAGTVENCSSSGMVDGKDSDVGGLIGFNTGGVSGCYSEGTVDGRGDQIGGLVGTNWGDIAESFSSADVTGQMDSVGGLVGFNEEGGTIIDSYATGTIIGADDDVGGLVGTNDDGQISNCYATGSVTGVTNVGGLLGDNDGGTVASNSYATGDVTGEEAVGGLVGRNDPYATISDCFYNNHAGNPDVCVGLAGGDVDCNIVEDREGYFFDPRNSPMAGWDFTKTWKPGVKSFQVLQWEDEKRLYGINLPDVDGDGYFDCIDQCPEDPDKVEFGQCGCGVVDTDSDKDLLADCRDLCPGDSKKIGPGVCGCGVSDLDFDQDGVADCNDLCPTDSSLTDLPCGPNCSEVDLVSSLELLKSIAVRQDRLMQKIKRIAGRAINKKKKIRMTLREAKKLTKRNQEILRQFPATALLDCKSAQLCVSVDNVDKIGDFKAGSGRLCGLAAGLVEKVCGKSPHRRVRKAKRLLANMQAAHEENLKTLALLPTKMGSCKSFYSVLQKS